MELNLTIQILLCVLAALVGGYLFRVRGVDEVTLVSRTVERGFFTIPFPVAVALQVSGPIMWQVGAVLIASVVTYAAVVTGHGSYMGLGRNKNITKDDEKLRPVVRLLVPNKYGEETWAYQFVGMTTRGIAVTLIAGVTVQDVWLALSGAMMGLLYELSWRTPWSLKGSRWIPKTRARSTQWGEWYFGAVTHAALMWSVL